MSEEVSSPFQITIRDFDILHNAITARVKKLKADAQRCRKMYEGKVTTEMKIKEYENEAEELDDLLSRIGQEFS